MNYKTFVGFINPELRKYFLKKELKLTTRVSRTCDVGSSILFIDDFLDVEVDDFIATETNTYVVKEVDYIQECLILSSPLVETLNVSDSIKVSSNYEGTLKNALELATQDCNSFVSTLIKDKLQIRFDTSTYITKQAMIFAIDWILQNKGFKKDISVSGANIENSDVFENFYKLRQLYKDDIKELKQAAYDEMFDEKQGLDSGTGGGCRVIHRPIKINGRYR